MGQGSTVNQLGESSVELLTTGVGTPFQVAFRCVRNLIRTGQAFERTEAFIDSQPGLDTEERALLWLLAWAGGEPSEIASQLGCAVRGV